MLHLSNIRLLLFLVISNCGCVSVSSTDTITRRGTVKKCCQSGHEVNLATRKCQEVENWNDQEDTDDSLLRSRLSVISPRTGILQSRHSYNVRYMEFQQLCEEGSPLPMTVMETNITMDGFLVGSEGDLRRFDCLDLAREGFRQKEDKKVVAWVCHGRPRCGGQVCLEKCCREHQVFGVGAPAGAGAGGGVTCIQGDTPLLWSVQQVPELMDVDPAQVEIRMNNLTEVCPSQIIALDNFDSYIFTKDGRLNHINFTITRNYCFEHLMVGNMSTTDIVLRCLEDRGDYPGNQDVNVKIAAYSAIAGFSLFCLVITFTVYLCIPDFHNLHGKIVLMNITSIVLVKIFIIVVFNFTNIGDAICIVIGFFGYFSTISMFSWMTIMSCDLGWTFSHSEVPRHSSDKSKFRLYSSLGWGLPILLTGILVILQFVTHSGSSFNPGIGRRKCFIWWGGGLTPLYYFYIPILVLMCVNSVVFGIIVISIFVTKRRTRPARSSSKRGDKEHKWSRINSDTLEQLILYTKLFFILGILWSMEAVHAVIIKDGPDFTQPFLYYLFTIADIFNLLRGFFMFVIFVCKKNVWRKIKIWWRTKYSLERNRDSSFGGHKTLSPKSTIVTTHL